MSTLTKVFVVLLVVLSLLLAAASVTFLNTLPDYNRRIETLNTALAGAEAAGVRARAAESAGRTAAESRAGELTRQLAAANDNLAQMRTRLAESETRVAELQGQLAQANTQQTTLATAVNNATTLVSTLRQEVATLRETYDRTLQQNLDLSRTLATTSNDLEYTQRTLRATQEQLKAQQDQTTQLSARLEQLGFDPQQSGGPGSLAPPPIAGVIVQRLQVGGQEYAMISVGTEDDVQAGMRFNVLDSENGTLLGFVTVEQVDDQVSIGKLSGPRANDIGPNDEVRTRL